MGNIQVSYFVKYGSTHILDLKLGIIFAKIVMKIMRRRK
jgi:hypothetical protein